MFYKVVSSKGSLGFDRRVARRGVYQCLMVGFPASSKK